MNITIEEAAAIMQRSWRTVYEYIETGKLTATRVGRRTFLDETEVRQFVYGSVGRKRLHPPRWHTPNKDDRQSITCLCLPIRSGKREELFAKLQTIHLEKRHLFPGTIARYITYREQYPESIQILLVWRHVLRPPGEECNAALQALHDELAEVLEWEDAHGEEHVVLLRA